jgi:hypothetical protein
MPRKRSILITVESGYWPAVLLRTTRIAVVHFDRVATPFHSFCGRNGALAYTKRAKLRRHGHQYHRRVKLVAGGWGGICYRRSQGIVATPRECRQIRCVKRSLPIWSQGSFLGRPSARQFSQASWPRRPERLTFLGLPPAPNTIALERPRFLRVLTVTTQKAEMTSIADVAFLEYAGFFYLEDHHVAA